MATLSEPLLTNGDSDAILPAPSRPEDDQRPHEDTQTVVESPGCCHPSALCHRLAGLFLMCLLGFGSYFCFDNPGALQHEIKDTMEISTFSFSKLYAWYSWPNVLLPIVGGYLMDSVLGMRLGTVVFATIIIIGQVMFGMGAFIKWYPLMEIGRFVFGIGGESLAVAQNTYAVSWFKGKELNMVFGFQLSVARLGSTVNFLLVGPLFALLNTYLPDTVALGWTLMAAGSTCVMSFLCSVILGFMDKRRDQMLNKEKLEGEKVVLRDIFSFPAAFWLLSVVCLAYYVAIFPFISLGQVFFLKKYHFDGKSANFITGLIYLISAPASPLLGYLIDRTGRNIFYVVISVMATLIGHLLLAFTFLNPYACVVLMGVAYSLLASALWPIAALIVPEEKLGTAYGLMQAIQNLGLAVITLAAGSIVDHYGYLWLEIFFIFWLVVALVCSIIIWLIDLNGTGYLNMGVIERSDFDAEMERKKEAAARKRLEAARRRQQQHESNLIRIRYMSRIGAALPPHLGHAGLIATQVTNDESEVEDEGQMTMPNGRCVIS